MRERGGDDGLGEERRREREPRAFGERGHERQVVGRGTPRERLIRAVAREQGARAELRRRAREQQARHGVEVVERLLDVRDRLGQRIHEILGAHAHAMEPQP